MAPSLRQRNQANSRKEIKKMNAKKTSKSGRVEEAPVTPNPSELGLVYPSGETAFKALLSARFCAAIWSNISDCDETYNYWEPSHYLLFGKGFETWEYSPQYALRSYTYLLLHVIPAWFYHRLLQPNRLLIFYFSRCLLGLLCAVCEVYFYRSICREFGVHVGRLTLAFMVFGAGMFVASTAYLPSSFSMYMAMLSLGAWYQRKYEFAIFTTALSTFLSWPFAGLLGAPIAVDMLFRRREFVKFFEWCIVSVVAILLPMVKIDSQYFGRLVVAPYNLVVYNVFGGGRGPDLYGTEPWYFYFINGMLNFNFVFLAALMVAPALLLAHYVLPCRPRHSQCLPYSLSIAPFYLWILVFFFQPHKEERFLFPIYPLICLCGALSVDVGQKLWFRYVVGGNNQGTGKGSVKPSTPPAATPGEKGSTTNGASPSPHYLRDTIWIALPAIIVCSLLGTSRILALYKGYHAPFDVFMEFSKMAAEGHVPSGGRSINVCMGKEWYRFPSSFFLPDSNWNLKFIQSEFRGQLPKEYDSLPNATMIIPEDMNDMNREETSRYVSVKDCHFLVDLDLERETTLEPRYSLQTDNWTLVASIPFLDAERSHKIFRAFYIPWISERYCTYASFNLLQSTRFSVKGKIHRASGG
ncbi:alpha-1,2-mannosyltransferase ALG9 [Ischnura elegans]|uniref:alpha-1,2-mannosyltransferase ALG9 n=1 Tax=Ischnura elegans TaxID=197161 RepID=UPI001ED89C9A|nr:alpha-1,2-mannosyltransferase ALG9 [Ischnura elegans]